MIKVMFDPGHGGSDRANRGPTGYIEADGVIKISKLLRDELNSTGAFEVKLTRETDATLGLTTRGKMAADWGAQLFISEHTNACDGKTRGVEVYESVDLPDDALADKMAAAISAALGIPNRGGRDRESIKYPGEDYYTVIDTAQDGGVPHVMIVESAFHDNPQDEALLKQDAFLLKIAKAQAKVICELFGVTYPATKNYTYTLTPYGTHFITMEPKCLRSELTGGVRSKRNNWINANFFSGSKTIGWMASEGKILCERHMEKLSGGIYDKPKGTLIVAKDGKVDVGLKTDAQMDKIRNQIQFCCQGFNLTPLNLAKEGFNAEEVGRTSNRVAIGLHAKTGKIIIAVRPNTDAATMATAMNNLGCLKAICLDSGGSTNLVVDGKEMFKTDRTLTNIIYW